MTYRHRFQISILNSLILLCLSQGAMATEIGFQSYLGLGSSNLSPAETSAGLALQIDKSIWRIESWDFGLSFRAGSETVTGQTQQQQRQRLDTLDSISLQGGLNLRKRIGMGHWSLVAVSGPTSANLRMNDSTPQSATVYKRQQLTGWQNNISTSYRQPISERISATGGLLWRNSQIQLDDRPFSFTGQDFSPAGLTLTEGSTSPVNFRVPRELRSQSWAVELGILLTI